VYTLLRHVPTHANAFPNADHLFGLASLGDVLLAGEHERVSLACWKLTVVSDPRPVLRQVSSSESLSHVQVLTLSHAALIIAETSQSVTSDREQQLIIMLQEGNLFRELTSCLMRCAASCAPLLPLIGLAMHHLIDQDLPTVGPHAGSAIYSTLLRGAPDRLGFEQGALFGLDAVATV
jgi:hypothetical protein